MNELWITALWICSGLASLHILVLPWLFWAIRRFAKLSETEAPEPASWPRVTVVIPARDEAGSIEGAISSWVDLDYENLEIVLVNDRSRDETGAIMDDFAKRHENIQTIHVTTLPKGWLGKLNAMEAGRRTATGEWIVFADADVSFRKDALRHAVAVATQERLDFLTGFPRMRAPGALLQGLITAFGAIMFVVLRPHTVNQGRGVAGVGAFMLVRASRLEQTAALEWIRLEVADDTALALAIRMGGGKLGFYNAVDLIELEWYPSVPAMVRGLEKNAFAAFTEFSILRVVVSSGASLAILAAPWILMMVGGPMLFALGAAALVTQTMGFWLIARQSGYGITAAFLGSTGQLIGIWILWTSMIATLRRDGIDWRGTTYSIAELKAGKRVSIGALMRGARITTEEATTNPNRPSKRSQD